MMKSARLLLFLVLAAATVFAQFNGTIQLGTADVSFLGENEGDNAGWHISIAGDVNNDGFDDILIGSPFFDSDTNKIDNGAVYLVFGKAGGWNNTINLQNADASFVGEESNNQASHDVFGVKDVNGDGIDDFAIGVKFINQAGLRAGKTYIFFGKTNGWQMGTPIENADATILGEGETSEAAHVNGVGNMNGDEYDDIIIGAGFNDQVGENAGKIYIFFGKPTAAWPAVDSVANCDASFIGEMTGDWAGHRVAGVGDVNADGLDDFIIGANRRDHEDTRDRGICYLVLGKTNGWAKDVVLTNADASFYGPNLRNAELGWNVAGAGDVNGDHIDDFLLGAAGKSKVYLILGKEAGWNTGVNVEDVADAIMSGEHNQDFAGGDLRTLGDVNMDGYDDFIIGAFGNDQNGSNAGKAYLMLGRATWPLNINLADADAGFIGENSQDFAGFSVAGGGDIDHDGADDVLISANQNDENGPDAGKVYLFFSRVKEFTVTGPNGGEVYDIGQTITFAWNSKEPQGNVRIELSRNNGATWDFIMDTPDDGQEDWISTGPGSDLCLVRMTQLNSGSTDQSNSTFSIAEPTLLLTAPNGGEVLTSGDTQAIMWQSSGNIPKIKIEYSTDSGASWTTIQDSTANDGRHNWLVPNVQSTQCLIRIQDARDGNPTDTSDGIFEIRPPAASLKVTSPNGGETWQMATTQNITWTSSNTSGTVKIEISRDNGSSWTTLIASTPDNNSWQWNVAGPASTICLVRISDTDGNPMDTSDAVFSITNGVVPQFTVTKPNGGETWEIGTNKEITWTSENSSGNVKIELSRNNGSTWQTLRESTPDDGSLTWDVTGPAATKCLVRVSDVTGGTGDISDNVFTIYGTPVLEVTAPNGGEDWAISSTQDITWNSAGSSGNVNIYLSRDNGTNWEFLISTEDDGIYGWTVTGPESNTCLVLISNIGGNPFDISDNVFQISQHAEINITSPVGGEIWQIQTAQEITWTSIKTSGNVKIELSRDNGSVWEILAESTADDGLYTWVVSGPASALCLIKISDAAGPAAGTSPAIFSISEIPTLRVLRPNGGEVWMIGDKEEFRWSSSQPAETVNIYLSRDNGTIWDFIASVPDTGAYPWQVTGPVSDSCMVLISTTDGSLFDTSDLSFKIVAKPQITVLSPNGGENWLVGSEQTILWNAVNTSGAVQVDLSRDNGRTWVNLGSFSPDPGQMTWTVAGPLSDSCLVKVSDIIGSVFDTSDAIFSISGTASISVLQPQKGEVWLINENREIKWNSQFVNTNILIELSRNGGTTWETVADNAENNGSYIWKVLGPEADRCIVRVSDVFGTVSGVSDSLFLIRLYPVGVLNNGETIRTFGLYQNFPNPFNPETRIAFQSPQKARVSITIYDVQGRLIRSLIDQDVLPGEHSVTWDGRDHAGVKVPSGVYFYIMKSEGFTQTQRMLILK